MGIFFEVSFLPRLTAEAGGGWGLVWKLGTWQLRTTEGEGWELYCLTKYGIELRNFDQILIFDVMTILQVLELLKLFAFDILAYNSSSS